jgi:uncharacterized membrane protein YciS (DUF1049 family)
MISVLKWIVLLPIAALVLCFAVANRHSVTIFFNPIVVEDQEYSIAVPLYLIVILVLMVGVFIGGIAAWLVQGKHRRAARRAWAEVDRLKTQTNYPQVRS